jgi:nucleotide-binding universal stress UspA family protein
MKGTILHPTDFSSSSRPAFNHALALAREQRGELLLVHVLPTVMPMVGEGYMSPKTFDDLQQSMRAQAQKQLDRLVAKAKAARVRARGLLYEGVAADAIARAARAKRAKLIVMGTHGRTGLTRLFMGSVAERVVGTAPCPVLTVRGK